MNSHTFDLVLSHSMDELVNDLCIRDTTVSDHFWVEFTLPGPKLRTMKTEITFRKIKAIGTAQFINDITLSALDQPDSFNEVGDSLCLQHYTTGYIE